MDTINSIECNVIGNGPSCQIYIPNNLTTITCHIPWTKTNYTILFDSYVIDKIIEYPDSVDTDIKIVMSNLSFDYILKNKLKEKIKNDIIVFKYNNIMRMSSGHYAAEFMINQGFTKLNLYGMDNYFGDLKCLDSFSHSDQNKYQTINVNLSKYNENQLIQRGCEWKNSWTYLIKKYKNVEFNFLR